MRECKITGADDDFLCRLALLQAMITGSAVLILSATKKAAIEIRDTMTVACDQFPMLRLTANDRTKLAFDNDSRILFRVARPWAGCGLSISLLIINETESIKQLDDLFAALLPTLSIHARAIFCTK